MIMSILIVGSAIAPSSNVVSVGELHQHAALAKVSTTALNTMVNSRRLDLTIPMLTGVRRESIREVPNEKLFDGNIWIRGPKRSIREWDVNARKRQLKRCQLFRRE
jgi:hypothetical protein